MPNTHEFIRALAQPVPTPQDKGTEVTIKIGLYDNGGVKINSHYFTSESALEATMALNVQIAQILRELVVAHERRGRPA